MTIPHTKFWVSLVIIILAFVGLMFSKISGGEFATIAIAISTIYGSANVAATYAHRTGD